MGLTLPSNGELRAVRVFTVSGTWTKPAALKRVRVFVVGGGGGGGGAYTPAEVSCFGGGGGAGGYAWKLLEAAALGATETVTLGLGGASGVGVTASGNGGASSFGSHLSATGGAGGLTGNGNDAYHAAGGLGVGGDALVFHGGYGKQGAFGGAGGMSPLAPADNLGIADYPAIAHGYEPLNPGAGGCGGRAHGGYANGSAGHIGTVIVEEYY